MSKNQSSRASDSSSSGGESAGQELAHIVDLSVLNANQLATSVVEGLVWSLGIEGFERLDADTFSEEKTEEYALERGETRWRFTCQSAEQAETLCQQLRQQTKQLPTIRLQMWCRDITGYRTAWKHYFKPYRVTDRLIVHPPWDIPDTPADGRIVIEPGMAFGTGTHQTTRLCLELIDEYIDTIDSIFDIGTGSGVLLIGAAKLGVSSLYGVDIDPIAIPEARRNAKENNVDSFVQLEVGSARDIPGTADLVIANILPHILRDMRDALVDRVRPGGLLLLSGIPWEDRHRTIDVFDGPQRSLIEERRADEWSALLYRCS